MLTPTGSLALGFIFLFLGGFNVWLVLESWSRAKTARLSSRMLVLHRIGGYVFIALFCVMTWFMLARLRGGAADSSPNVTIHLALAMILSPLLFVKVLIARYYRNQHALLTPLGLTIFVLAFVLIASTAGPYLARATQTAQVSIDPAHSPPVTIDLNQANDLMRRTCSKCHNLDRVIGARKDAQGWLETVTRMRGMTGSGISETDARTIVAYLASQNQPRGSETTVKMEVERALVDQRCGRCHGLDRVYKAVETPAQWREIVTRMVSYADDSTGALRPGEDRRIIEYLSATQTPAAVAQRKAQAEAAALAGQSLITTSTLLPTAPSSPSAAPPHYDRTTIAVISLVCLAGAVLVIRKPGTRTATPAALAPSAKVPAPPPARAPAANPFVLQLVQLTPQTADATTLRFAVMGDRRLHASPGQFLTFSFLFDGKKETRCYSICSSPVRSGYVEITPKRVKDGCVSVFLNTRAAIGMTVEATGPFGQFCLEPEHRKIVLLAGGSGITPMMAMLRYLDDLCLNTEATLLYCARTADDIIFRQELDGLAERLKRFRYHVLLSQPDEHWSGGRGHISGEFIARNVPDSAGRVYFLCGPPPFMEAAKRILGELGVPTERIKQEIFGGAGAPQKAVSALPAATATTIEFVASRKTVAALEGQTILEAAAAAGVAIPSACRQGQCGTCKTRLLTGQVQMTAEQGLDAESRARGFVLTCVGHATGNVSLDA